MRPRLPALLLLAPVLAASTALGTVVSSVATAPYPIAKTSLAQPKFYVAHPGATNTTKTLPPTLDLEVDGALTRTALITWAQNFLIDLLNLTGRTPMIYTYPWFWQVALGDAPAL